MKKSVIFLISIIYLVSIVVVTFFGMKINIDQFEIYMANIEITTYTGINNQGTKFLRLNLNDEGYASAIIEYNYGPDNATHPDRVEFSLTGNKGIDKETGEEKTYAKISNTGELLIYNPCAFYVILTTSDGSALKDELYVRCYE